MKTITSKTAKNGVQLWYVDGKRIAKSEIFTVATENHREIICKALAELNIAAASQTVKRDINLHFIAQITLVDNEFAAGWNEFSFADKAEAVSAVQAVKNALGDKFREAVIFYKGGFYAPQDVLTKITADSDETDTDEVKDDDSKLAELFQDREVKRRAALHSSFDSDESKAARDANKAVEEFIGKVAKDLRAIAPVGLSVVASWDSADLDAPKFVVIELATDKRTCYGKIAEVKAALTVTKTVTVKAENATHAVEILDKLNFRNVEFVYHGETNEHGAPVVYRHFDGIKDGHDTCFGLIEIVINGKLDAVRFINNYREQFTDIKIGNAKYTLGDKGEINLIDEPETKTDTPEENVEKLFDAYEAQNSVAHISENGYIAAVNFQPQNTVRWHCKIRRYENLDEAIDAVRYVNEHDSESITRGGRVETEYGKRNERTREYFARNLYGVEYFKEAYFDELVDQYAVTVDAFNFATEREIELANASITDELNNDDEDGFTGEDFLKEVTVTLDINAAVKKIVSTVDKFRYLDQRHEITLTKPDSEVMWERDFRGYKGDETFLVTEVYNHPDGTLSEVFLRKDGTFTLPAVTVKISTPNRNMKLAAEIGDAADTVKAEFDKAVTESVNEYSATVEINGETLTFEDGQLSEIGSKRYGAYFKIRDGRKIFYYRGNRVSKQDFFGHIAVEDKAISERAAIGEFVAKYGGSEIKPGTNPHGNFVAQIHPTLANGRQDNYEVTFDDKAAAYAFIDEFKTLAGDMKFIATIKRGSFYGEEIYRHGLNGQEYFAPDESTSETKESLREKKYALWDELSEVEGEIHDAKNAISEFKDGERWLRGTGCGAALLMAINNIVRQIEEHIEILTDKRNALDAQIDDANEKARLG